MSDLLVARYAVGALILALVGVGFSHFMWRIFFGHMYSCPREVDEVLEYTSKKDFKNTLEEEIKAEARAEGNYNDLRDAGKEKMVMKIRTRKHGDLTWWTWWGNADLIYGFLKTRSVNRLYKKTKMVARELKK